MPTQLRKLNLDRVDLVPQGANPGAHIVLAKAAEPAPVPVAAAYAVTGDGTGNVSISPYTTSTTGSGPFNTSQIIIGQNGWDSLVQKMTFDEVQRAKELQDMLEEVCKYTYDLQDAVFSSLYNSKNPASDILKSIDQFKAAVDAALAAWTQGKPVDKSVIEKIKAQLTDLRATLEKERKVEIETKKSDEQPPETGGIPAEVQKALDDQRVLIEKLTKANEEQANRIAKAEEDARVEKEKRERLEFTKTAEAEIPNLPGTPEEKGALLQKVYAHLDKADADAVLTLLKGGNAAQKQLIMGEIGKATPDTDDSAKSELTAKAEEINKAEPRLTKQQAFKKACDQNPELFDRHRRETRRTVTN